MAQRILLDFDGVVFNNPSIQRKIGDKSIKFVKNRLKIKNDKDAKYYNATQYPVMGHSALLVGKNAIADYNQEVFFDDLSWMHAHVDEVDKLHLQHILTIKNSLESDVSFHLCTNAPLQYCTTVFDMIGIPFENLFDNSIFFTSDEGLVKPQDAFWENILAHDAFLENNSRKPIDFVDDSLVNILGLASKFPRFNPHFINNKDNLYYFLNTLNKKHPTK